LMFCCGFEETLLAPGARHLQKGRNCAIAPIRVHVQTCAAQGQPLGLDRNRINDPAQKC
jgi:hypothetical protein